MQLHPVRKRLLHHSQAARRSAMLWPDSTSRTAPCLNSSVYLPRFPFLIYVSLCY